MYSIYVFFIVTHIHNKVLAADMDYKEFVPFEKLSKSLDASSPVESTVSPSVNDTRHCLTNLN